MTDAHQALEKIQFKALLYIIQFFFFLFLDFILMLSLLYEGKFKGNNRCCFQRNEASTKTACC